MLCRENTGLLTKLKHETLLFFIGFFKIFDIKYFTNKEFYPKIDSLFQKHKLIIICRGIFFFSHF